MHFNMYIYQYLELNWWYAWESISSKNKHDIYFQNPIMQFIILDVYITRTVYSV